MKLRLWLLTFVVVLANVSGNVILKQAMLYAPPEAGPITSILQPVAVLGIAVLTAWMLLRMWLLGMADLSFVVPVSAVGYVLSAFAGVFFFHERVPARGWIGTVVIMLGAILTGLTEHSQPPAASSPHASLASPDRDLLLSRDREGEPFLSRDREGESFLSRDREGAVASSASSASSDPRPSGAVCDGAATGESGAFQSRDREGAVLPSDAQPQPAPSSSSESRP